MEHHSDNAMGPLAQTKQRFGILPTSSFWYGKTDAYRAVSTWFLMIYGIPIALGVSGLFLLLGLESTLVPALTGLVSLPLTLGILERIVRIKIDRREQKYLTAEKEGASAKRQLLP